jgi:hypothetical protein
MEFYMQCVTIIVCISILSYYEADMMLLPVLITK